MEDFIKLQGIFEEGYGFIAKKVMRDKDLNVISKAVYSYICSYSGKGKDAFPSQKLICFDLGISKDTLSKYMKELKLKGYVGVKQSKTTGKFARNIYTINIVPCMISSDTVSTDTEIIGYGQVDTNNNSFNNNNKSNNNIDNSCNSANDPEKPKKKKRDEGYTDDFLEFWKLYNKSVNKPKSFVLWKKKNFSEEELKKVMEKVKLYVSNTEKQYRKDPERYIRDNCWENEVIIKSTVNKYGKPEPKNISTAINNTQPVDEWAEWEKYNK